MATVDFSEFQWFTPKPKNPFAVTIPNLEYLHLNPPLREKLAERVMFGVGKGGRTICIRDDEAGYKVIQSGDIKDKDLVAHIVGQGVHLPARYTVTEENSCWIAVLEEGDQPPQLPKKVSRKARNIDLASLKEELKCF